MRLALGVDSEADLCLKPLGALNAVVFPEVGEVLRCFSLLEYLEMPWICEVGLDLIDIPSECVSSSVWKMTENGDHLPQAPPGFRH